MTLVIAWIGKDQKKSGYETASLYIGSDSQFTWDDGKTYLFGQKVYGSNQYPHIFGFCGDVTFAQQIILRLISLIDFGGLGMIDDDINQIIKKQKPIL